MRIWLGICVTCLLAVGLAPLAAQDVAGVSPETHKLLLDNEHARVFDVRVKPGERVGMHTHPAGVVYFMSDSKLQITYPDGRQEERTVHAGTATWIDGVTHAVQNVGSTEFHEIHIELKDRPAAKPTSG
jgi:quercetin dioxygenase-like cupin family protein